MVLDGLKQIIRGDESGPAIVVESLTEEFRRYREVPGGLKERLTRFRKAEYDDFQALKDVSFTINHGETVGIIGHNGSGKSTLLKVLARILPVDEGHVETNGRVASLLELGAGMHGDLSGRENIQLNGAILGLSRDEIEARFDDIVDFAGIRDFLDTAVRNYSSGMYVRLGFAIAVNVDPDILLVDEVLSVGDAVFQHKSMERMRGFKEQGKTIVIVSHDLQAITDLCDRTIVLHHGELVFDGPAPQGVQQYANLMGTTLVRSEDADSIDSDAPLQIDETALFDRFGTRITSTAPSQTLRLRMQVTARRDVEEVSFGMILRGTTGDLYEIHSVWQGLTVGPFAGGETAVLDLLFTAHVLAGRYWLSTLVTDTAVREQFAVAADAVELEVLPSPGAVGVVDLVAASQVAQPPTPSHAHVTAGDRPTTLEADPIPEYNPDAT